jgi:hypothetical protein
MSTAAVYKSNGAQVKQKLCDLLSVRFVAERERIMTLERLFCKRGREGGSMETPMTAGCFNPPHSPATCHFAIRSLARAT